MKLKNTKVGLRIAAYTVAMIGTAIGCAASMSLMSESLGLWAPPIIFFTVVIVGPIIVGVLQDFRDRKDEP